MRRKRRTIQQRFCNPRPNGPERRDREVRGSNKTPWRASNAFQGFFIQFRGRKRNPTEGQGPTPSLADSWQTEERKQTAESSFLGQVQFIPEGLNPAGPVRTP